MNLGTLDVSVISPLRTRGGQATWGPPAIKVRLQFETAGEEVDNVVVNVDLETAVLFVNLEMTGDFDRRGPAYRVDPPRPDCTSGSSRIDPHTVPRVRHR